MTKSELDEIEKRTNAAMKAPWMYDEFSGMIHSKGEEVGFADDFEENDMDFITKARTDIPRLLARVRELEAKLKGTKEQEAERWLGL